MESWQCHLCQSGVNPWHVLCVHVCVSKVNQKVLYSFEERLAILDTLLDLVILSVFRNNLEKRIEH